MITLSSLLHIVVHKVFHLKFPICSDDCGFPALKPCLPSMSHFTSLVVEIMTQTLTVTVKLVLLSLPMLNALLLSTMTLITGFPDPATTVSGACIRILGCIDNCALSIMHYP
jgi:hypothetical protein